MRYRLKTYRRTKPGGTCGELLKILEIEAAHLADAQHFVDRDHVQTLDFRYDFAILEDDNGAPFVTLWLSNPRA
ncbi:MAG TPA: hypothetical protein VHY79_19905 [Rhizomicrobium sp.]|jgi:hypothetical protein|nr:hypothetical protein [Rhizomicrobium sp.]